MEIAEKNEQNAAGDNRQNVAEKERRVRDMACSADGAQVAKGNTNKACDMASLVSENKRVLEENASSLSAPGKDRKQDFLDFITALDALNEMAEEMWEAGMNEKACLTEAQIYTSSAKILGESHPAALKAMYNYALGLAKTGRNEESAAMLNKYLEIADSLKEAENDSSIGKDGK